MGFEIGDWIYRVQVKSARLARNDTVLIVCLHTSRTTPAGYVRTRYQPDEIDLVPLTPPI